MTDLAQKTRDPTALESRTRPYTPADYPPVPPSGHIGAEMPASPSSWPRSAKLWMAILAVAGLLLGVAAVIGFTTGDDSSATEQDLQTQIESITVERDGLVTEVTDLQATLEATTAERDDLQTTLEATTAERDDLQATLEATTAERDDLAARVGELDNTIATLTTERDGLLARIGGLEIDLVLQTQQAATAIAAQEALEALFPVGAVMTLDIADVVGTYDVGFEQAYCDGFATCATMPNINELTIRETADHRLELMMPDYPTAGLLQLDGVLYAVLDVSNDATACGTTPRIASVTVTVFAQGMTVDTDGTQQVTDLMASMTMHAPATPTCEAGTAIYAAQLTP